MNRMNKSLLSLATGISLSVATSQATVLLGTSFDDRILTTTNSNNDTATNLNWTLNGIADPGGLTASPGEALANGFTAFETAGLFNSGGSVEDPFGGTIDNSDRFAPDLNIHNEGSWYVDVPVKVLGGVSIDTVTLDAFTLNNGGNFQGVGRDLEITMSLTDSSANSLGTLTASDVFAHDAAAPPQPTPVVFEVGGLSVPAGDYTLRLTFGADNNLVGNNAGLDNLVVYGTVVPEPSSVVLLLLGGSAFFLRRNRR